MKWEVAGSSLIFSITNWGTYHKKMVK